jgi:hypothetical protein
MSVLTIIDTVTKLVKLFESVNMIVAHIAMLSKTPGCLGIRALQRSSRSRISASATSTSHSKQCDPGKEPEAISICEQMHQAIGISLFVLSTMDPPREAAQAGHRVDTAITNAVCTTRCATHSALKTIGTWQSYGTCDQASTTFD